jgi:hypothetical protein
MKRCTQLSRQPRQPATSLQTSHQSTSIVFEGLFNAKKELLKYIACFICKMVNISWLAIVVLCHVTGLGQALITLEDVKTLTDVTRDCIREINSSRIGLELGLGVDQSVVSDGDDEDDEDDDEIVCMDQLMKISKLIRNR